MPGAVQSLFVIDTTFLVRASREAFLGAPLLEINGGDQTFDYGICRDLLRLRQAIGAQRFLLAFGSETYGALDDNRRLEGTVTFLTELGVPIINEPECSVIDICTALVQSASHFVSTNSALLQLTKYGPAVILVDASHGKTVFDANAVHTRFGVAPSLIPDLLALTEAPMDSRLTTSQAVRLLERFGGLTELLEAVDKLKHHPAVSKLKGNQAQLLESRARLVPDGRKPEVRGITVHAADLDTQRNRESLRTRKFHSLVRLLPTPKPVNVRPSVVEGQKSNYLPVVDGPALERFLAAMGAATVCAIDTEATGKDPHRAELLGVSFCFKKGEAFYIPLSPGDLRDLDSAQVLRTLREVAQFRTKFVGHNLKYDYVLLRRHGVELSNLGFDTMLAAHECFHDWEFFNLKYLAKVLLGKTIKKYREVVKDKRTLLDVPFQRVVHYACEDADTAFQLYESLRNELQIRGLQAQFESGPMNLASQLAKLEFHGISVDEGRLEVLRMDARQRADNARDAVQKHLGKIVNVDSDQEVQSALLEDGGIAEFLRGKRPTTVLLEALAETSETARKLVQYRRKREVVWRIEEVLEQSQGGKVHPIFNQIRSRYGQITARQPNLFATNAIREAVDDSIRHLYSDPSRSLHELVTLSMDDHLPADLGDGYLAEFACLGEFVGEFLLSLAIGTSDSKLTRKFLLDQSRVGDLRHRMRLRYRRAFEWLDAARKEAVKYGFVENEGHRYYVAGLSSSNLHKRQQATNLCVRWLLQY